MDKEKPIKVKKVKGVITTIQLYPYKGIVIYIRKINEDIFEYLFSYNKEMFSAYYIIKPSKNKSKLTKNQIIQVAGYVFTAAVTTIDWLLDPKNKDKQQKNAEMRYNKVMKKEAIN